MTLPDSSNLMTVGEWRYIQSIHEPPDLRNPDTLVRYFLPLTTRWRANWLRGGTLRSLRSNRFYYYLLARTKYYDTTFQQAVDADVRHIINIGCGTDTRSYRFLEQLKRKQISVLECDQPSIIRAKQLVARRRWRSSAIEFLPLDLNDSSWPDLVAWLASKVTGATFVQMEGVSPYVETERFSAFLELMAAKLPSGSRVAYDFKRLGVDDRFGREGRTAHPFRLPLSVEEVGTYHAKLGYTLEHLEASEALSTRLLPQLAGLARPAVSRRRARSNRNEAAPAPGYVILEKTIRFAMIEAPTPNCHISFSVATVSRPLNSSRRIRVVFHQACRATPRSPASTNFR